MSGHYVYVIAKIENGEPCAPVKIGISNKPAARLGTLQTACPFKIGIVHQFSAPDRDAARYVEKGFHDARSETRLQGEWFDTHPTEAVQLLCLMFRLILLVGAGDEDSYRSAIPVFLGNAGVLDAEAKFCPCSPDGETIQ